tara:strand:- start:537 stop:815 length:279 start_codon:yes stop_codon:yes gene_type:complete
MAIANAFNRFGGTGSDPGTSIDNVMEDLTSSVNGERTQFQSTQNYDANSLVVYINGLKQRQNTIGQIGSNTFTISSAPLIGDILEIEYTVTT